MKIYWEDGIKDYKKVYLDDKGEKKLTEDKIKKINIVKDCKDTQLKLALINPKVFNSNITLYVFAKFKDRKYFNSRS